MRSSGLVAITPLIAALLLLCAVAAAAQPDGSSPDGASPSEARDGEGTIPGHYIVVLKDSVEHPAAVAARHSENRGAGIGFIYRHALKGYAATLAPGEARAVAHDPQVAYVEPDARGGATLQQTPTGILRTYAGHTVDEVDDVRIDADVAVLDSGIAEHPDLNVVSWVDCTGGTSPTCVEGGTDNYGHGTHVAGTIGALDNGFGVVGVAPGVRLWSIKILDDEGFGTLSQFIAGLDWVTARANQIEVTNASVHLGIESVIAFGEALDASIDAGIVNVAAAGNSSKPVEEIPAGDPDEITVSALADFDGVPGAEEQDKLAGFSNYGPLVDIAAPGVDIYSTKPGGYAYRSGTSMASPHVAGAAAVLASVNNPESREDVEEIRDTLVEKGNLNWNDMGEDGLHEPLLDLIDNVANPLRPATSLNAATNVSAHGVTVSGAVNPKGSATSYQFEIGYPPNALSVPASPKAIGSGSSDVEVSAEVGGLKPATTYYFRIFAKSAAGWGVSKYRSFTTVPAAPSVTTEAATGVGKASATLNAKVNPENAATTYQFEYGPTTSYGTKVPISAASAGSGTSDVAVSKAISELTSGTTYHYRIAATNSVGTTYGADKTLTTTKTPKIATGLVTDIASTEATLNASINPEGKATLYWFEYGETTSYGSVAPVEEPASAGSGTSNVDVSEAISGLAEKTTYHYRVVAFGGGYVIGADRTFTTPPFEWTQESGSPTSGGEPYGVSCSSGTACTSIAATNSVRRWNGSSWSTQSLFKPAAAVSSVNATTISCPTATFCMAGTSYFDGSKSQFQAQRWNGTEWAGDGAALSENIADISCASASSCVAIGEFAIRAWNGTEWTSQSFPNLEAAGYSDARMTNVSCSAANACMVVGHAANAGPQGSTPFALRWNGSSWTIESMPIDSLEKEEVGLPAVEDVACASANECFAVGSVIDPSLEPEYPSEAFHRGLFMRWNGAEWALQSVSMKGPESKPAEIDMRSVSCTATAFCVAAGRKVSLYWAGGEWLPLDYPANHFEEPFYNLSSVSCAPGKCIAVGMRSSSPIALGLVGG